MKGSELPEPAPDFGPLVALVEETGERVTITEDGAPAHVLIAAADLAETEHFAQRYHGPLPVPVAAEERPPGPEQHGDYTRYIHADGHRATFTRGHLVVAELRSAAHVGWLDEQAMYGRQEYMDPKQAAAFAEFLARQPPVN